MVKIFVVLFCLTLLLAACQNSGEDCVHCNEGLPFYNVVQVSEMPLFNANGEMNIEVLSALFEILDNHMFNPNYRDEKTHWSTGLPYEGLSYTAITAADFSAFVVPEPTCMSHSGAIAIQLFEGFGGWWQLVYRSTDENNDVLTLWMTEPYRLSHFNGTRYDNLIGRYDERYIAVGDRLHWENIVPNMQNTIHSDAGIAVGLPPSDTYFFEANYSASIVRSNLLRDFSMLLEQFNVANYIVPPKHLPGNWQSSMYQTGTNSVFRFYSTGDFQTELPRPHDAEHRHYRGSYNVHNGLGAAGLIWSSYYLFSLANGMDGLSVGPYNGAWVHTAISPIYYDLIWLPSDFETRSMGHNKDLAMFQTFLSDPGNPQSNLRWNTWAHGRDPRIDLTGGRSGLWQLNGYDRAFNADPQADWENRVAWLRSADVLGIGSANTIYHTGNRYGMGVQNRAGVRPALHLCLNSLRANL